MAEFHHNKFLIQTREEEIARMLAARVIHKPDLNVWMILIPIIFVFHFFRLSKTVQGRKDFLEFYMLPRRQMLDELCLAMEEGREPQVATINDSSAVPPQARAAYAQWITLLRDHYYGLLKAKGDSFDELVRKTYGRKAGFIAFLDGLGQAEQALNKALAPEGDQAEDSQEAILRIETAAAELRKEEARRIFP